jgi:hypothetical protein
LTFKPGVTNGKQKYTYTLTPKLLARNYYIKVVG